ncbi:hypothetical protein MKS88_002068 [Plasmodium brasilianum]|uniref:Uncharacterized protein n=2 Tax=Plasmodium (Plasmodium) TaxID=418103 RepID=A0A1D3JN02_PLAMA|nr:conserved Plasmodium protein, unknown function [Plasmodium malariae]KAI4839514.1 hypothetical protein MKS88_002068 [Plasmodium brasilianum]SBT87936.1 conserved Plasmodium protein, unknown function [Plasmodium malariae]
MGESAKTKIKRIMESPYSIELQSLDQAKSNVLLRNLLGIIRSDKSLNIFLFNHDEIMDSMDHDHLRAIILIRTNEYEKFYKHIPIIASLKKIPFVLIERNYFNTIEFNILPDTSHIGIRNLQKENDNFSSIHDQVDKLILLINSYYVSLDIPYLFSHPSYVNTKFKVERVHGKAYAKNLSRKERKKIRKSLKKNNI